MFKSINSKIRIGVHGIKLIAEYLKKNISKPSEIAFFEKQDKSFFQFAKNADILVAMSWGKSKWGGTKKIEVPQANNLKLLHLPGAGVDGINFDEVSSVLDINAVNRLIDNEYITCDKNVLSATFNGRLRLNSILSKVIK